jgi:hypothetical protein
VRLLLPPLRVRGRRAAATVPAWVRLCVKFTRTCPESAGSALVKTSTDETFSPAAARALHDRVGRWQDTQRFYEDRATAPKGR